MALRDLFRPEAVDHHRQRLYGEVVLTMPATHWAVTLVIAAAIGLLIVLLVAGSYARKETIGGWVRSDRGVVRLQAQDDGVVESVLVSEGQVVEAGTRIVVLRLDPDVAPGQSLGRRMAIELEQERRRLVEQRAALQSQYEIREVRTRSELAGLEREVAQYRMRQEVLDKRVALAQRQLDERASLVKQGFVSKLDAERLEDAVLAARQVREEQAQDTLERENKATALRYELASLPHERAIALAAIGERIALLEQRSTQAERRASVTLSAPVAGRVADVRVHAGESTRANTVLVDIIPEGARLQVELFAPSRAAGFLAEGSQVQLRYDAFPYQKFGVGTARVTHVSRSTMDARDLPRAISADEPVYRVVVALDDDHVLFNGARRPLRAGMTLKADLILERRRIVEFLFAPLFGAARRG